MSIVVGLTSVAAADDPTTSGLDRRWPTIPDEKLSIEDRITDHLTEMGNSIADHMNKLSDHMLSLHVDGRRNRARLAFGGGNAHYLEFKVDSDWLFADGKAHVQAKLELGLLGHKMDIELPNMDLSRDSYGGQDMVTVNVSVLQRRF